MFTPLVVVTLLLQVSGPNTQTSTRPVAPGPPTSNTEQAKTASSKPVDAMDASELLKVKRIYVDSFGDDTIAKEMQSMIVSALVASKRFKVTENRERADAILKGVALEKTSQEVHAYGEGTVSVRANTRLTG